MDRMGSIPIGQLLYPTYNLVVVAIGLIAALGLWWFIYRTKFGVILRATSQDRRMAAALGLNVGRVYVQAFAIGCFMAGLGGRRRGAGAGRRAGHGRRRPRAPRSSSW